MPKNTSKKQKTKNKTKKKEKENDTHFDLTTDSLLEK